jgi:hypothetical protein
LLISTKNGPPAGSQIVHFGPFSKAQKRDNVQALRRLRIKLSIPWLWVGPVQKSKQKDEVQFDLKAPR